MTVEDTAALKRFMNDVIEPPDIGFVSDCLKQGLIEKAAVPRNSCFPCYTPIPSDISMAWIEITTGCNLRCHHCYNDAYSPSGVQMSFNDYRFVVDELAGLNVPNIQLIGGEPLIVGEKLLKFMLSYTLGKFKSVEVFTNATLLTDGLASFFAENKIRVAVSVYSYDASNHDGITHISGSHKRTLRGIGFLKKHNVCYRVANILMAGCELENKNTELFTLSPDKDVIRMSGRGNKSLLTAELIRKRLITEKSFTKPLNRKFIERLARGHNCFVKDVYIAADLNVYPCVMERRMMHGNLRENNLRSVLNPDIQNFNKSKIDGCKDCEFRLTCFDCRPDTLTESVLAKPWYCTYDPYTGQFADPEMYINTILSSQIVQK